MMEPPVFIDGKPYGPKCARLILEEKEASRTLPHAVVDTDYSPLPVSESELQDHIYSLGLDDMIDVEVIYSSNPPDAGRPGWYVEATYNIGTQIITIYSTMDEAGGEDVKQTLSHEYGHAVWFQIMDDSDYDDWERMYERAIRTGRFVTEYSSTSVEEFFAECFAFYVHEPSTLKMVSPSCYDWIKDRIFNGRSFE